MSTQPHNGHARTTEERNALVVENIRVAEITAKRMYRKTCGMVEYGTLLSGAMLGLIGAAEKFDPSRGVQFSTLASRKCQGAILEDLRNNNTRPRLAAHADKVLGAARRRFYAEHGRMPTDDEERRALGVSEVKHANLRRHAGVAREVHNGVLDEDGSEIDHSISVECHDADRADWWMEVCRGLTRVEKSIVLMYFRDGLTLAEIARVLGICESRVSQLKEAIVARMKASPRVKRLAECAHAP